MITTTHYKLGKSKTFRRTSCILFGGKKNLGYGTNLQNIEKSLREIFIPFGFSEDLKAKCRIFLLTGDTSYFSEEELVKLRIFIQVDQSGAEALIVAYECRDGDYRQLFTNNVKPHVYVALKLFPEVWKQKCVEHNLGITPETVDEIYNTTIPNLRSNPYWKSLDKLIKLSDGWATTERYYYFAKQTCHSANYGIEWARFILNILEKSGGKVVISEADGKRFLQVYRALFPEIPERNARIREIIDRAIQKKETPILYNLHSHPFIITNYNITEQSYKEYYAWSAQSTVGEITRIAFTNLQSYIEDNRKKWDIVNDCHDSYLVQCPLTDVKECSQIMQQLMNQKLISPSDGTEFHMKSEANIGFNWSSYKPEKNELGLQEIKW